MKIIDIVRLELCGAVLSKRLRELINREVGLDFERTVHLVDSEIVKAMINRNSYGFNTFAANRIGEIHQGSKAEEWFWICGKLNVSDLTTRGADANELSETSWWQKGPKFLEEEISQWPITSEVSITSIPELKVVSNKVKCKSVHESLANRIDIQRFSRWERLKATTARILKLYSRYAKGGNRNDTNVTVEDLQNAEDFWVKEAQAEIVNKLKDIKFIKLNPQLNEKGIVVKEKVG